jgi:ribosome-binding factor A
MSIRAEKVASVIKRSLAEPISRIASENSAGLVTITSVRLSNDLQVAKVYLSIYGGKMSPGKFMPVIEERVGALRSHIGKQIKLRFTPELRFFLDDTLEQMERIQNLLDSAKKADEKLSCNNE